ncbi:MAG: ABC transporter ATP-binding protein [Verrucomicrobia bacterium]|nr:ABC transporter ATP-binding protein [Verrucomicrobiota bacterium]
MANQSDDLALSVKDLRVQFDTDEGVVTAVENVSFDVKRGRVLAIVGESGSGKSVSAFSILRLIQKPGRIVNGQIQFRPAEGKPVDIVGLSDRDPLLYDIRGGYISMIFQEPMTALSPVHTIGNQICEAILVHQSLSKKEAEKRAIEMLALVGISDPEQRLLQYPHEFSGGMRQRVVIAMALVCRPEILIADEPTTALDVTIQAQILQLIKKLQEEMGTSVIFITHDLGVVAQIADDVVVMYQGRIVEKGTVREILKDPFHPYTKGLLAAIPSQSNRGRRLTTVDKVIGDLDLSANRELKILPSGRAVALSDKEIAKLSL